MESKSEKLSIFKSIEESKGIDLANEKVLTTLIST